MLQDLIALCLNTAVKDKMSSIAFPTVGCGRLGFSPTTVAECFRAAHVKIVDDDGTALTVWSIWCLMLITRTWLCYVWVFAITYPSVVCNVRARTVLGRLTLSALFLRHLGTLAVLWPPCKILWRSSQGHPSVEVVKHKSGSKIDRCHVKISHLLVSFLFCK